MVRAFSGLMGRLSLVAALCFGPVVAVAGEIMFEGYYRIEASGKPIGYTIQRFEFDKKSKTFEVVTFLRAKVGDDIIQESLKAKSNDKFHPLSYQYTSQVNDKVTGIDASFSGTIMKVKKNDGKNLRSETHKIPEGTFLSSFLVFMMLQKKISLNTAFKYSGVAEEEGASYWGKAWFESKESKGKLTVFRVVNSFKGEDFTSQLAAIPNPDPKEKDKYDRAEILATMSDKKGISTKLVASPSLATEGQTVPNKILVSLFGNVPTGKVNLVATPAEDGKEKAN